MDWRASPANLTSAADFWALWQAEHDAFAAVAQTQDAARSGVAALALLAWDIVTTMDDEVSLIWPSAWTVPKVLYLFVRYYSLIALRCPTHRGMEGVVPCVPWLIFEIMSASAIEAVVQVIMILRTHAIYMGSPKALRAMVVGFVVEIVLMTISFGLSIPHFVGGFYCKAADLPVMMVLYSTASIVYETFLLGMMLLGVLRGEKDGYASATLLDVLVRDGTITFVGIFMVMLLNTVLFTLAPTTLVTLGIPWVLSILGVAGPRLILNLRVHNHGISSARASVTSAAFALPKGLYSALALDD
ncbi:uncharacterized protein BXZ73DRAFT_47168, partial [Epithele typhae]|uniref:uncharacterized protein n=1 Tax=Epithele typhae TaxID=378194 RepID=UPI002007CD9E